MADRQALLLWQVIRLLKNDGYFWLEFTEKSLRNPCLTQTYATGFLDQRDYQSLSQKVQQEFGSTPLLELAL